MNTAAAPTSEALAAALRVFEVRLVRRNDVETSLLALRKRAARKGLDGAFSWSWGRAYVQTVRDPHTNLVQKIDRVTLTIEGETPQYQGWTFVSALDHMTGDDGKAINVVRNLPGEQSPVAYRTRGPVCDHCEAKRRRNSTYVLRHEDSRHVQVGSTCIEDFLGHDGFRTAALAQYLAEIGSIAEDDEARDGGARQEREYRLDDYLPYVAAMMRHDGWHSRASVRDKGGMATADLATMFRLCKRSGEFPRGYEDLRNVDVTDEDRARAERAIAWAEAIAEDVPADYLHNVRAIALCNLVTPKTVGIAASIIAACERQDGQRTASSRARTAAPAYFGTPKKREVFVLTLVGEASFETQYGVTYLYRFLDGMGSTAVWKASSNQDLRKGTTYRVKGTVREHGEYKGMPQTVLTRCDVEGEVPAAAESRAS